MNAASAAEKKKHHKLGPSASHRWMVCPGEPDERVKLPNVSSIYADEGTTAHWVGEQAMKAIKAEEQDAAFYIGKTCPETGMTVTDELAEDVQIYIDECLPKLVMGEHGNVEEEFELFKIHADLGGTCDFWTYHAETKTLYVRDLKFGRGKVVYTTKNPQLLIYAVGAAVALCRKTKAKSFADIIETLDYGIVQPRAGGPPVRVETMTGAELENWAKTVLRPAALRTDTDKSLVAGDHCGFCPFLAECPAQSKHSTQLAKVDFSPKMVLPSVNSMTIQQLSDVAIGASLLSDWAEAAKARLAERIKQGEQHPLWKIVSGRPGNRRWANDKVKDVLKKMLGDKAFEEPKLKSPAQVEKLLKTAGIPLDTSLVVRPEGQPALVPITDSRPSLKASPETDFGAITVPRTNQ